MFNKNLVVYHNKSGQLAKKTMTRKYKANIQEPSTNEEFYSTTTVVNSPIHYLHLESTIQKQILELYNHLREVAGGDAMSNYDKMIDRLDQDMRDHKQEMRDRDALLQSEMKEREERYRQDRKELEERFLGFIQKQSEEAKEREERMLNAIRELKTETKSELQDIKNSVDRAEQRIDATAKHVHSMVTTNFWGRIATVVAILAVAISLWAALKPSSSPTPPTSSAPQDVSQK